PAQSVEELATATGLPRPIASIMINRGMDSAEAIERFLEPSLDMLEDPFSLKGMESGVERVCEALRRNERITIYGDYDVDGITATSLLYLALNKLGAQVSFYLPNRLVEGYGLSIEGIDKAAEEGSSLIVTVDTGITAGEEIEYARSKGIEVIVTDHHEAGDRLPKAVAIVNPKQPGCSYTGGELSGVGVAFKFAQGLYQRLGQRAEDLYEHLDLVALGTSADIVPLVNENRVLTKFGIREIARTAKPGLKSLVFVSGLIGKELNANHVIFVLAPRINAIGRLGDASMAIRLLTTRDDRLASEVAHQLEAENKRRKAIDEKTLNEALEQIEEKINDDDSAIVLASEGWHQGVIGIVASRLVERRHVPTVMIAIDNGVGKGSARSIPGFHLCEALKECEDLLLRYGGHKYAAGLSIEPKNIPEFAERFKQVSSRKLDDDALAPKLHVDYELELEQIDNHLLDTLERFEPYGPKNLRPLFLTRNCEICREPSLVGRNHLRMRVRKGNSSFDVIGFGLGDFVQPLRNNGSLVDLVYVAEYNEWNGVKRMQLQLKDIRFSSGSLNSGYII
ncbi:MAG TPA: single-stranded-DNA-specific exonuclease RecJ, partial [candidate division Zixibacteria bacterium]|nr:single-stranded-DNA-specific exonuclease RecJ [candidate division Zixibacteria bacterium]